MNRNSGTPLIISSSGAQQLEPVPFGSRDFDEGWLQNLMHKNPQVLPVRDIWPGSKPIISLGREIPTAAGPIDNLFLNSDGEIVVVEAKLWRNPESRRKVVAQILDYAAALSQWSFEDLESEAQLEALSLWEAVRGEAADHEEAGFVDAVADNLSNGRFLLLIVGDGIRADIEALADLLGQHPQLAFHLELVELGLYTRPGGHEMLVVPTVVGRTVEVNRATVEVRVENDGQIKVAVEAKAADESLGTSAPSKKLKSFEEFLAAADAEMNPNGDDTVALVNWWESVGYGGHSFASNSIGLTAPYAGLKGGALAFASLYASGEIVVQRNSLTVWNPIIDPVVLEERLRADGYVGKRNLGFTPDLSDTSEDLHKTQKLLTWIAEQVAAANELVAGE